jgi:hypothetical protein
MRKLPPIFLPDAVLAGTALITSPLICLPVGAQVCSLTLIQLPIGDRRFRDRLTGDSALTALLTNLLIPWNHVVTHELHFDLFVPSHWQAALLSLNWHVNI